MSIEGRKQILVDRLDVLQEQYDAFMQDTRPESWIEDDSPLDLAIRALLITCETGDIPGDCRELVDRVKRLGVEYHRYKFEGDYLPGLEPTGRFWAALANVIESRKAVAQPRNRHTEALESVAELVRQGCNHRQIAKAYGIRGADGSWSGPFWGPNNTILSEEVEKEEKKPGSVITDKWVHPMDNAEAAKREAELTHVLNSLHDLEEKAVQQTKPASDEQILAGLDEGQFPHQVAKELRVPVEVVYRVARDNGRNVGDAESSLREGPRAAERPDPIPSMTPQRSSDERDPDELEQRILELRDDGLSAGQIAAELGNISQQKAAGVIRKFDDRLKAGTAER